MEPGRRNVRHLDQWDTKGRNRLFTHQADHRAGGKGRSAGLASTLAGKADLGVRLKKAYDTHDLSTLEIICEEVIPGIINDLSTTRLLREHLWMQDAKPFGYELVDIKLSGVIARLTSTRYRLRYYIDGRVKRLEELEADRLPYFLPGTPKRENLWHRIISGADLMDTI